MFLAFLSALLYSLNLPIHHSSNVLTHCNHGGFTAFFVVAKVPYFWNLHNEPCANTCTNQMISETWNISTTVISENHSTFSYLGTDQNVSSNTSCRRNNEVCIRLAFVCTARTAQVCIHMYIFLTSVHLGIYHSIYSLYLRH